MIARSPVDFILLYLKEMAKGAVGQNHVMGLGTCLLAYTWSYVTFSLIIGEEPSLPINKSSIINDSLFL